MSVKWDEALSALAAERYPRLIGRAMLLCGSRPMAEDLVQEALVSALRTRRSYESLNQAEQYVRRAIASRYVDAVRSDSASRRREAQSFDGAQVPDPAGAVGAAVDLASALATLPPRARACVALRYLDGLSTRETADALGLSEGSVKRYVSDGIKALNVVLGTSDTADDLGHVVTPEGRCAMTGLGELFDEAEGRAASAAGDARLEGDELGVVHSRVRRAHARRSALRASLVAVAVVVLGAGVAYGIGRSGETEVITTPSPSVSPSVTSSPSVTPSPSSSPSPSETGFAWPGFTGSLTVDPHVPDAAVITREAWDSSGPGWALVSYREAWFTGDVEDRGPQVIYLVSPQGERYELVNVPGDTVSVLAWEAGEAAAAVSVQPEGDPPYFGVIDLVTGEVTPMDGYAPYLWSIAFLDSDGVPVWRGNDATAALLRISADGIQKDYKLHPADGAAELAEAEFDGTQCGRMAPYDEVSVLIVCGGSEFPDLGPKYVVRVNPGTSDVELLYQTDGDNGVGLPFRVGDNVVAPLGGVDCAADLAVVDGGTPTLIPGVDGDLHPVASIATPFGAVGDELIWGLTGGCSGDSSPIVVVASDLASDDYAVLAPYPVDRPAGEDPYESVTGVAVAH